ncbi:MAG: hypothetical protein R2798_14135 [Chitinophagales bacterium]|nr:hypothetical protein [Bacteroidota bacterium]MCB9043429.1 hypothetical protein [Chitinophagales bacterium]
MIKKFFFVVFMLVLMSTQLIRACDACGCSAGSMGMGLLADYRTNFVRLSYFNTRFTTSPEHDYLVKDNFMRFDLSMRYAIGKSQRIKFTAHVPYGVNIRKSEQTDDIQTQGFSDAKVLVHYVLANNIRMGKKSALYLETGTGINFPTGKYEARMHNLNLPDNFNIGLGSWGYIFQLNTIYSHKNQGFVWSNFYQFNSKTTDSYHFGNQLNTQLSFFKEIALKSLKLIPNAGVAFEHIYYNTYATGSKVPETGGKGTYFTSALNFKTEKWLAGASYALPMAEKYAGGLINAQNRFACHISYIF